MGRKVRPVGADVTYHLTARGNDQEPIFLTDEDRHAFLATLTRVCERYEWTCHGYCLMGNHLHLAVTTLQANLPHGMCHLIGQYARKFNRNHRRKNHVFGHRYHSVVIASDGQLLATIRYIARNPSRAGIVGQPQDWPWSSYPAAIGLAPTPRFLDPGPVLSMFHTDPTTQRTLFRDFVDETVDDPTRPDSRTHLSSMPVNTDERVSATPASAGLDRPRRQPHRGEAEGRHDAPPPPSDHVQALATAPDRSQPSPPAVDVASRWDPETATDDVPP